MKKLVVKDWLWQKIAKENNAPRFWDDSVFAVIGETEKAYRIIIGSMSYKVITWIPKSQCEWQDTEYFYHQTRVCTFEQGIEWYHDIQHAFC